ncbi:MAG: metal ABC transporter permease [Acutalibacteraceae bacterium]|nr:metal ABC transporter permease [Acutalibacteraceae bacterium]
MSLLSMFEYGFMVRALVVGIPVALCAALLGVSLVLKRYSMIGDGLSHVGFGALAIASAFNWAPLPVAIPIVILAAFLLLRLSENSKINGDSAIALISSSALAIGVTIATMQNGMNTDISNYLFGSIVATSDFDAILSVCLSIVVIVTYIIFYHRIFAVTFDERFAKATGTRVELYNIIISILTALTVVLGMRIMGTLLISSLIIFPALTAMQLCKTFKSVIITSAVLSVVCFFIGISISYLYSTPTGASIVIVNLIAFIVFTLARKIKS